MLKPLGRATVILLLIPLLHALPACAEDQLTLREELIVPPGIPDEVASAALASRILLHALPLLRAKLDLSLHAEPSDHDALTVLLTEQTISFQKNTHTHALTAEARLTLRPTEYLRHIARTLDLLELGRHLLWQTQNALAAMDRLWPGSRLYTRAEYPPSLTEDTSDTGHKDALDPLSAGNALIALVHLRAALLPTSDDWLTRGTALETLEEAARQKPEDPWIHVLLAEARLNRHLPQLAQKSASQALSLAPDLLRARYVRALAHWQLQQFGLAENDLSVILKHEGNEEALLPTLRARGALRMLLGRFQGMCQDFSRACSLGDCDGLRHARSLAHCLPEPGMGH